MLALLLAASVTVAPALVKVRPGEPLPALARADRTVELVAAKGECEGAHVIVSAGETPTSGVLVKLLPLVFRRESITPAIYREAFLDVTTPSNLDGARGLWPDALVPDVDLTVRERRNAFPFDVPAGRHQPIYVEVCVPPTASTGIYEGSISVKAGATELATVRLRLDVRDVTIPPTSRFPVTFGLSGRSLTFGHFGEKRDDATRRLLVRRYAEFALRHRISLHVMTMFAPPVKVRGDAVEVDFRAWDEEIGDLMDGRGTPWGARFSAIDLRTPADLDRTLVPAYGRVVAAHFRERGWLDRLFAYVMDEPKPAQAAELRARLEALEGTGIRRLVTTSFEPKLAGLVDVWTPNVNCLFFKADPNEYCHPSRRREDYRKREAQGDEVWWYASCSSHGCGSGPFGRAALDAYFRGWPSYVVDVDGASARIMGWLAFTNDVAGELHFDGAYAYNPQKSGLRDPWREQWAFGGNGDGTLFYPGRPDRIGGATDVPVASLRLVTIRDGLEDRELLEQLAARSPADAKRAREIAQAIAPRAYAFSHDPQAFDAAHRRLLDALAPATTAAPRR